MMMTATVPVSVFATSLPVTFALPLPVAAGGDTAAIDGAASTSNRAQTRAIHAAITHGAKSAVPARGNTHPAWSAHGSNTSHRPHASSTEVTAAAHAETASSTDPTVTSLSRTGKSGCRQNHRGAHREHFQHDGPPLLKFVNSNSPCRFFDPYQGEKK
jgi:hypothetical protein